MSSYSHIPTLLPRVQERAVASAKEFLLQEQEASMEDDTPSSRTPVHLLTGVGVLVT